MDDCRILRCLPCYLRVVRADETWKIPSIPGENGLYPSHDFHRTLAYKGHCLLSKMVEQSNGMDWWNLFGDISYSLRVRTPTALPLSPSLLARFHLRNSNSSSTRMATAENSWEDNQTEITSLLSEERFR